MQWLNPTIAGSNVSPLVSWSRGDPNGYVLITSVAQNILSMSTTACIEANAAGSFRIPTYTYAKWRRRGLRPYIGYRNYVMMFCQSSDGATQAT